MQETGDCHQRAVFNARTGGVLSIPEPKAAPVASEGARLSAAGYPSGRTCSEESSVIIRILQFAPLLIN
jgi:hypothetical protein